MGIYNYCKTLKLAKKSYLFGGVTRRGGVQLCGPRISLKNFLEKLYKSSPKKKK